MLLDVMLSNLALEFSILPCLLLASVKPKLLRDTELVAERPEGISGFALGVHRVEYSKVRFIGEYLSITIAIF
jgi:hypothetical protein